MWLEIDVICKIKSEVVGLLLHLLYGEKAK